MLYVGRKAEESQSRTEQGVGQINIWASGLLNCKASEPLCYYCDCPHTASSKITAEYLTRLTLKRFTRFTKPEVTKTRALMLMPRFDSEFCLFICLQGKQHSLQISYSCPSSLQMTRPWTTHGLCFSFTFTARNVGAVRFVQKPSELCAHMLK